MKPEEKELTIDLMQILKSLWHRAWIIAIAALLAAAIGFAVAAFFITPQYSSSVMLYVNNKGNSASSGGNISQADINAAQSLVKTYCEILNNRTTLDEVIKRAELPYTYTELSSMITAGQSNNTEVMKVTVQCSDPDEAAKIANCIAEVLPVRIAGVIDGSSMKVVEYAVPNAQKVEPSVLQYTLIGFLLGFVAAAGVICVLTIMDDTVHSEEYILQTYPYPILAKIPDLMHSGKSRNYYYA